MEMRDAERLRAQHGNKPCRCEKIERERDRGINSGYFVCAACGRVYSSRKEWQEYRRTQSPIT